MTCRLAPRDSERVLEKRSTLLHSENGSECCNINWCASATFSIHFRGWQKPSLDRIIAGLLRLASKTWRVSSGIFTPRVYASWFPCNHLARLSAPSGFKCLRHFEKTKYQQHSHERFGMLFIHLVFTNSKQKRWNNDYTPHPDTIVIRWRAEEPPRRFTWDSSRTISRRQSTGRKSLSKRWGDGVPSNRKLPGVPKRTLSGRVVAVQTQVEDLPDFASTTT